MVEHVSRIFGRPLFRPVGLGSVVEPCNFWIFASPAPVWVLVGLFFGWVLGFSRPVSAETFFVESLILAQDERWRRA